MTPEQLVEIQGIGEKMVEKIHQSVAAYFEALESQGAAAAEGTEGVVAEEGALEGELEATEQLTEEPNPAALEMTPEEAAAEGEQEALEESAESAEVPDVSAAEEAAAEANEAAAAQAGEEPAENTEGTNEEGEEAAGS